MPGVEPGNASVVGRLTILMFAGTPSASFMLR
jgi:hypothetical protein